MSPTMKCTSPPTEMCHPVAQIYIWLNTTLRELTTQELERAQSSILQLFYRT